jgi:hypothetical protein
MRRIHLQWKLYDVIDTGGLSARDLHVGLGFGFVAGGGLVSGRVVRTQRRGSRRSVALNKIRRPGCLVQHRPIRFLIVASTKRMEKITGPQRDGALGH